MKNSAIIIKMLLWLLFALVNSSWLNTIVLNGDYYEMGQQYGRAADIAAAYNIMVKRTFIDSGVFTFEELEQQLFSGWPSISTRQKQIFYGMSNSTGMTIQQHFILDQIMYAFILAKLEGRATFKDFHMVLPSCSFAAIPSYSSMFVGRNLDWFFMYREYSPLLAIVVFNPTDGSQSVASLAYAGAVNVLTGYNSAGVFLELNSGLGMMGTVFYDERSRYMNELFEILLDADSLEGAFRRVKMSRPDFSNIINMADAGQAISLENSVYQSLSRSPGILIATNIYWHPQWGIRIFEEPTFPIKRYQNLETLVSKYRGSSTHTEPTLSDMKFIMEQPLQTNGNFGPGATIYEFPAKNVPVFTVYSAVMDVAAGIMSVRVPSRTNWTDINLTALFA